jgi:hypothetical protein
MLPLMRLRKGGTRQSKTGSNGKSELHSPLSSCRTVTTLNMPACMCISMWQ